eukprot:gnl/TRDRNA2_/TRDRNA2_164419_c0_seq1.p1 gnl/TRDRNA2_/TRDRNA2_164419_c0~~gnl/TRDRNA2_/TRDRNA2_164419_c0_seq1.p1  ORF type:complete len:180 (+),score=21.26 gnl/TRDRNA2_/TRDRNA2_164419_c0_seq1:72-611(+)
MTTKNRLGATRALLLALFVVSVTSNADPSWDCHRYKTSEREAGDAAALEQESGDIVALIRVSRGLHDISQQNGKEAALTESPSTSSQTAEVAVKQPPGCSCRFPFKFKGVPYNSCTQQDYSALWCGTFEHVTGTHDGDDWTLCEAECMPATDMKNPSPIMPMPLAPVAWNRQSQAVSCS